MYFNTIHATTILEIFYYSNSHRRNLLSRVARERKIIREAKGRIIRAAGR